MHSGNGSFTVFSSTAAPMRTSPTTHRNPAVYVTVRPPLVAIATARQTNMPKFASGHSLPTPTPVRELGWTTALFGADHSTVYLHTCNQVTVVCDRAHSDPYLSGWVAGSPTDARSAYC